MNGLREIEGVIAALERKSALYMAHATLCWLEIDMARVFAKAGFKPSQPRVPRGQPGGGQWTGGGGAGSTARTATPTPGPHGWANIGTLERHVKDHGKDFGITSQTEYAKRAQEFYRHAQQSKLPAVIDRDGNLRFYDPKTNTFGAYNPDGSTRTLYKPPAGERYFQNQINRYVPDGGRVINPLPASLGSGATSRGSGGSGGGLPPDHRLNILKPKLN